MVIKCGDRDFALANSQNVYNINVLVRKLVFSWRCYFGSVQPNNLVFPAHKFDVSFFGNTYL